MTQETKTPILNTYAVPYSWWDSEDDTEPNPIIQLIEETTPKAAIQQAKAFLKSEHNKNNDYGMDDEDIATWHFNEPGDDIGYVIGDPVIIYKDILNPK